MKDLILWFKDEALELLCIEDCSVYAAQERALVYEKGAEIDMYTVLVNALPQTGSSHLGLHRRPTAGVIEWPDFLEGLGLVSDPACQNKLARAYVQTLLQIVINTQRFEPERLWFIVPATVTGSAGSALRRAAVELYPMARAAYVLWEDLLLGVGLAQSLANKQKLKPAGEMLKVAALTKPDAKTAQMLHLHFVVRGDVIQLCFAGRRGMELSDEKLPAVLFHGFDLVLLDSQSAHTDLKPQLLPDVVAEAFSWQIIMRYGLTSLLNPADALKLEVAVAPRLGFGFADGERYDLPVMPDNDGAAISAGYFALLLSAEASKSDWKVGIFTDCRGGVRAGRSLDDLTLYDSKSNTAIISEVQKELFYCLGVFTLPDFNVEMRLNDQSRLLIKRQVTMPGMIC